MKYAHRPQKVPGHVDVAIASFAARDGIPPGDLALAAELETAGCGVAHFAWSDAAVDWTEFGAVVVRSCWDYHLRPAEFLAWVGGLESRGIAVVNSPAVIRWNADKRYLAGFGAAIPETEWIAEGASRDIASLCRERGWQSAVVKPLISASAHRTELGHEGTAEGPAMVQEFVPEIQDGEWSLMYFGGAFSHGVLKVPTAGDFRVQKEYGGSAIAAAPPGAVITFGDSVMARLPEPVAFARVDIVVSRRRGPLLMELEVIEPELFLDYSPAAATLAARAVLQYLKENRR